MTKRRTVQIVSVTAAALIALSAVAIGGYTMANRYHRDLEYGYRRAFNELNTYVSVMESTLEKSIYANTPTQQTGIAGVLMKNASAAKSSLSVLPLKENTMDTVQKFISQVEDFSTALSKKAASGQTITNEDRTTLTQLYDYAALLKADLAQLLNQFDDQQLSIGESQTLISNLNLEETVPVFGEELAAYAEDFQDYPTLIYDGPFSDHITQRKPKLLEDTEQISTEQAVDTAAQFFNLKKETVTISSNTGGNLPTINLTSHTKKINVTQQGGIVLRLLDTRTVKKSNLTYEQAKQIAEEFLQKNGLGDFKESYYVINDNLCTMQFFAQKNGATLYPDLIKVSVALDNGEIAEYNAAGYIMNHTERTIEKPALTLEEARKIVSPALTITTENLAVIPTASLNEVLCYEFLCTGKNQDEVLVYINAQTGMEEQIFIVLRSDNGVLTI